MGKGGRGQGGYPKTGGDTRIEDGGSALAVSAMALIALAERRKGRETQSSRGEGGWLQRPLSLFCPQDGRHEVR